jgi:proline iminopeptidase
MRASRPRPLAAPWLAAVALGCAACESRVAADGPRAAGARTVLARGESDGGRWVDVADGKLRVESLGSGGTPVVVPLSTWFADDLAPLAGGRRVLFYGLRGRSRSPAPDEAPLELALDVRDLEALRAAEGLERLALVGIGYGAAVVAHYALAYPERVERLVLVAPLPVRRTPHWSAAQAELERRTDPDRVAELERLRAARLPDEDPEAWCRAWLSLQLRAAVHAPESLARVQSRPCGELDPRPERAAAAMQTVLDALGDWDWRAALAGVAAPALVVAGMEDVVPLDAAREWVAALGDGRLLELPDVARMPWIEDPVSFFVTLESFLADGLDERAVRRLIDGLGG